MAFFRRQRRSSGEKPSKKSAIEAKCSFSAAITLGGFGGLVEDRVTSQGSAIVAVEYSMGWT